MLQAHSFLNPYASNFVRFVDGVCSRFLFFYYNFAILYLLAAAVNFLLGMNERENVNDNGGGEKVSGSVV